jgi:hypothetical protein
MFCLIPLCERKLSISWHLPDLDRLSITERRGSTPLARHNFRPDITFVFSGGRATFHGSLLAEIPEIFNDISGSCRPYRLTTMAPAPPRNMKLLLTAVATTSARGGVVRLRTLIVPVPTPSGQDCLTTQFHGKASTSSGRRKTKARVRSQIGLKHTGPQSRRALCA